MLLYIVDTEFLSSNLAILNVPAMTISLSKHLTTKTSGLDTEKVCNEGNERQNAMKYTRIKIHYFKCKWTKLSNHQTELGEGMKTHDTIRYCLQKDSL